MFNLELFKTLKYWQSKPIWEKECFQTPGFDQGIVRVSKNSIQLKDFETVIKRLNKTILQVVKVSLSRDYMSSRNAIIMLEKLIKVYPTSKDIVSDLEKCVTDMIKKCEQDDLKTRGNAYLSKSYLKTPEELIQNLFRCYFKSLENKKA